MRRRDFATIVGGMVIACACSAAARITAKTYCLGTLSPSPPTSEKGPNDADEVIE